MASSAIDSEIFGDLFGTPAMRHIFADETLIQRYLDVEAALARGFVGLLVVGQGVLVLFEIDQAPRHLLEEHGPISVQA